MVVFFPLNSTPGEHHLILHCTPDLHGGFSALATACVPCHFRFILAEEGRIGYTHSASAATRAVLECLQTGLWLCKTGLEEPKCGKAEIVVQALVIFLWLMKIFSLPSSASSPSFRSVALKFSRTRQWPHSKAVCPSHYCSLTCILGSSIFPSFHREPRFLSVSPPEESISLLGMMS